MSFLKKSSVIAVLFSLVLLTYGTKSAAQSAEPELPFLYPDPRTIGVRPYIMQAKPAGAVTNDRYAGISEQERKARMLQDQYRAIKGLPEEAQPPCPLCLSEHKTPCGQCKMCLAGFPCENTLCRHCVQPRSKNMMSSCDLAAGDEPCGTCDACREHRSDPCEHADSGYGPWGEFNPYREPHLLSVIPRPILDMYNNGARKFPVYYNPAPYYRPTWNPSLFSGYARPFTFRWTCPLCSKEQCECTTSGVAGQVPYAYTCKICNRNPCACAAEICNVNKGMDPRGTTEALAKLKGEGAGTPPTTTPNTATSPGTSDTSSPESSTNGGGGTQLEELFDDTPPVLNPNPPPLPRPRPSLNAPAPDITLLPENRTVSGKVVHLLMN